MNFPYTWCIYFSTLLLTVSFITNFAVAPKPHKLHGGTCRNKFGQSINLKKWAEGETSTVKLQVSYFWILESADYFLEDRQNVCPLPLGIQPYVYTYSLWLRLNKAINYGFVSVSVSLKNLIHITYSPKPMPRKYENCICTMPLH